MNTKDGGLNWTVQKNWTSNFLNSVFFTDDNTGYVAGADGTLLKTTEGGYPVGTGQVQAASGSLKISPNPAADRVTVGFPCHTFGILSVIDLGGRLLLNLPVNADAVTLGLGHLPAGLFIIKLTSDEGVFVGKLLMIK